MARKTKRKIPAKLKKRKVRYLGGSEATVGSLATGKSEESVLGEEPETLLEGLVEEGGRKTRRHNRKFKKVLCSPAKKNNIASSCYSASELVVIKNAYNKHHHHRFKDPKKQIRSTDPEHILKELREKNAHCTTELCWLNAVDNKGLREKIQKEAFRPLQIGRAHV